MCGKAATWVAQIEESHLRPYSLPAQLGSGSLRPPNFEFDHSPPPRARARYVCSQRSAARSSALDALESTLMLRRCSTARAWHINTRNKALRGKGKSNDQRRLDSPKAGDRAVQGVIRHGGGRPAMDNAGVRPAAPSRIAARFIRQILVSESRDVPGALERRQPASHAQRPRRRPARSR